MLFAGAMVRLSRYSYSRLWHSRDGGNLMRGAPAGQRD
jgi:hypothetical protein